MAAKQNKTVTTQKSGKTRPLKEQPVSQEAMLRVDLWPADPSLTDEADLLQAIEVPHAAIVMVGDLTRASGGEVRESSPNSISAAFNNIRQAVNAVRDLQHLIRGFSRASDRGPLHICCTLASAEDLYALADAAPPDQLKTQGKFEPEKVLVIGRLGNEAKSTPGLHFKDLPPSFVSSNRSLQLPVLELLPPTHMAGYIDEPVLLRPVLVKPRLQPSDPIASTQPASIPAPPVTAASVNPAPATTAPIQKDTLVRPEGPQTRPVFPAQIGLDIRQRPNRSLLFGGVGAAVLAAILALVFLFKSPSKPTPQPASSDQQPAVVNTPSLPTSTVVTNPGTEPQPPETKPSSNQKTQPRTKVAPPPANTATEPDEPNSPKISRGSVTLDSSEISTLIALADKLAGNGDF